MAELLRIKPQVPSLDPGQVRVPALGGVYFGRGLEEVGDTLQRVGDAIERVQYGAAKAEATRSTLDGQTDFKNILNDTINTFPDENQFREEATNRIKDAYQNRLTVASKDARPLIEANLSNDLKAMLDRGGLIDQHYVGKTKERGIAEYTTARETLRRAAIAGDETEQRRVGSIFGELVGDMTRTGYMKRDAGAKELINFRQEVEAESMNLEAAQRPAEFIKKQAEGVYEGRDSTAVARAWEIATRTGDARAKKDAAEMQIASHAVERAYEQMAAEHRLNEDEVKAVGRWYGWPDEKINGLIKMQTGLVAANPYELIAIRDAMRAVDSTALYTMADIAKANSALQALVKDGRADVRTPEYVAAVRHLQSLRNNLNISADIQQRHSVFDARQAVTDLYKAYPVRAKSDREKRAADAERARALREVTEIPQAERKAYVDRLEKKLETERTAQPPGANVPLDSLRSIPRR